MLSQLYIKSYNDNNILCVLNNRNGVKAEGVVVLIPGFAQSKSDIDNFMTRLSNKIVGMYFDTVQVDLFAHGDSYGSLEEFSWNVFQKNIEDICICLDKRYQNVKKYLVIRGIYGNIVMNTKIQSMFSVICINPVLNIDDNMDMFDMRTGEFEVNKMLLENKEYEYLFCAMGCELTNIKGQSINYEILKELSLYRDILWSNTITTYDNLEVLTFREQAECGFVREFSWQEDVMKKTIKKLEEIHLSKNV